MAKFRCAFQLLFLISCLIGMVGCAHSQAQSEYALVNGSLTIGEDMIANFGGPTVTYQTSLIRRETSPFLVHESFTNDKRVLLVELLPDRVAGRVVSIHRNLMNLDASGAPTWSGVEILDSGIILDDELWDRVFDITDSLTSAQPEAVEPALLGTVAFVRTYSGRTKIGEHRMFSATAPEAPIDVARLGSLERCGSLSAAGSLKRYAVVTGGQGIVDIKLAISSDGMVRGRYRTVGQGEEMPLTGRRIGDTLILRSGTGEVLFEGTEQASLFVGAWTATDQGMTEAVMGCAVL